MTAFMPERMAQLRCLKSESIAEKRLVVPQGGQWVLVDDDCPLLNHGEIPEMKSMRFRTQGNTPPH
jgi:hypothetical protein